MFVDASAFLAILLDEPERQLLERQIESGSCVTSAVALFETIASLMTKKNLPRNVAEAQVKAVLTLSKIEVTAITREIGHLAIDAFDRYGKGRGHPAQLNMGDCFAYACAKAHGVTLLYKGDDFSRTELA